MKSFLVAFFLLLSLSHAHAASAGGAAKSPAERVAVAPWRYDIFPLNGELRWERDSTQQMVDRHPFGLAFGVRKGPSTVLFEYSKFDEKTGNATLALDRSHEEFLFWWKQNIMNFERVDFFISGGAGAYSEKVVTTLAGSGSAEDSTGLQMMGGVSGGVQSLLFRYVLVSFEGRLMAGKNFDPNPQPGMLLRVGVEF
jgi:hypothetical protein